MSDQAESSKPRSAAWWGFPVRLSELVEAPRVSSREIVAGQRPVLQDAVLFWVAQALLLRLPEIFQSGWLALQTSFSAGAARVLTLLMDELRTAAWVAIPVAILTFLFVGRGKRNSTVAMDVGAAASVVYALIWLPYRLFLISGVHGGPWPVLAKGMEIAAYMGTGSFALYAVLASRRGWHCPVRHPRKWPRVLFFALIIFAVVLNVRYIGSHFAALRPLGLGDLAPQFTLPRVDKPDEQVALTSMRGKVVVLDFWATWCPPCLALMPTLQALAGAYSGKGVLFVGVNADGGDTDAEAVRAFLAAHPATYPSVVDDGRVSGRYGVQSIPHLVVIDRSGRISKVLSGMVSRDTLEQAILQAM